MDKSKSSLESSKNIYENDAFSAPGCAKVSYGTLHNSTFGSVLAEKGRSKKQVSTLRKSQGDKNRTFGIKSAHGPSKTCLWRRV